MHCSYKEKEYYFYFTVCPESILLHCKFLFLILIFLKIIMDNSIKEDGQTSQNEIQNVTD